MKKTISSSLTFFYKYVFSTTCITFLIIGIIRLNYIKIGFYEIIFGFIGFSICAWFVYFFCFKFKRVKIDSEKLYVSNYLKEIEIEKNIIIGITENGFINIHPVYIHLSNETEFGRKIIFIPKSSEILHRSFKLFSSHPIVNELKIFSNIKE